MRIRAFYALSSVAFGLCLVPSAARAQDAGFPSTLILVEAAQPGEVSAVVGPTVEQPVPPSAPSSASTSGQNPTTTSGQNKVPPVEHTGLATLGRDVFLDFTHFPRRESTWIILGVGGGLALLAHPYDDDVNGRLASSSSADKFWKPGHIIGGPVMWGVPVALYVGGRYIVPHATDGDQTNKWSHLGLDLLRAEIVTEAIVQGLKVSTQRTRPDGSDNRSFPSGHAASTFALASVLERHLGYRFAWPTVAIAT